MSSRKQALGGACRWGQASKLEPPLDSTRQSQRRTRIDCWYCALQRFTWRAQYPPARPKSLSPRLTGSRLCSAASVSAMAWRDGERRLHHRGEGAKTGCVAVHLPWACIRHCSAAGARPHSRTSRHATLCGLWTMCRIPASHPPGTQCCGAREGRSSCQGSHRCDPGRAP